MQRIVFIVHLSLLLSTIEVAAQPSERPATAMFLIEGGFGYAGDEILQVFFTNGEDQIMRAGQGGFIAVGGQLQFANVKQLMLRASIGFKYNTTAAENVNIRLTTSGFSKSVEVCSFNQGINFNTFFFSKRLFGGSGIRKGS